jgi:hypothetical protein
VYFLHKIFWLFFWVRVSSSYFIVSKQHCEEDIFLKNNECFSSQLFVIISSSIKNHRLLMRMLCKLKVLATLPGVPVLVALSLQMHTMFLSPNLQQTTKQQMIKFWHLLQVYLLKMRYIGSSSIQNFDIPILPHLQLWPLKF